MLEMALEWLLRGFGLFWVIGGGFALHKARESAVMDHVLGAICGTPEDPLVTRFLFAGSLLTICSGAGLLLATAWVLLPLALLVLSQLVYFALLQRRQERPQRSTRNAFLLSLLLLGTASAAVWLQIFH